MKKILIADDEKDIVDFLTYNLRKEGFATLTAKNGVEALAQAQQGPDIILLDIMMPELDGLEVMKRLQRDPRTASIPIIVLTAKGSETDEVVGLELGASDYIVKPVSLPKLMARIKNILRKAEAPSVEPLPEADIHLGPIAIYPSRFRVLVGGKDIVLPRKEFEVLKYLASHAGQVVRREALLAAIWGSDVLVVDRTIDVHIRKIREKLGAAADAIETIKGVGYRMREAP